MSEPKKAPKKRLTPPAGHRPRLAEREAQALPEVYFDEASGGFYVRASDGEFIRYNETALRGKLAIMGRSNERSRGAPSEIDEIIETWRDGEYIRWAGGLAGHWPGRIEMGGMPVLITQSPRIVQASYGSNLAVLEYIERLLGPDQATYLYGWIKMAREALLSGNLRRAQAMIIVGAKDHGKSLLASLIGLMLGGRIADPTMVLKGETSFNAHMFAAEMLLMDDQGGGDDYYGRKAFGDGIKQLVGNSLMQCHAKGKTPISLTPFWRLLACCNDGLENLQVLPPLNDDISDKLIILRTERRAIDRETASGEDYAAYKKMLEASIPDFLGALERWDIPETLVADRFALKAWHHPWVVAALQTFSPQEKLMELIREEITSQSKVPVIHTAREIERILMSPGNEVFHEAAKLLRGPGSTGKYLMRLAITHPSEVAEHGRATGGSNRYKLFPLNALTVPAHAEQSGE